MAELRLALELVMIGAYGNLKPNDPDYTVWKNSGSELGFTRFRKRAHGMLRGDQGKWLLADEEFPDRTFQQLCKFTHSPPNSSDGELWKINGPVYNHDAVMPTFLQRCPFTLFVIFLYALRGQTLPFRPTVESSSRRIGCQIAKASPELSSNSTRSALPSSRHSHDRILLPLSSDQSRAR